MKQIYIEAMVDLVHCNNRLMKHFNEYLKCVNYENNFVYGSSSGEKMVSQNTECCNSPNRLLEKFLCK